MPGITDAHLHLADAALAAQRVDLEAAATLDDGLGTIALAAGRATDTDAWIEGGGWDSARWGRWPTAGDLERWRAGRRVALWSHDHHALWVSRPACSARQASTTRHPTRPAAPIRRDGDRRPTGVLQETRRRPWSPGCRGRRARTWRRPSPPTRVRCWRSAWWACTTRATSLADAALTGGFAATVALADRGELPIRVHSSIRAPALRAAIERGLRTGAGGGRWRGGGTADGAPGDDGLAEAVRRRRARLADRAAPWSRTRARPATVASPSRAPTTSRTSRARPPRRGSCRRSTRSATRRCRSAIAALSRSPRAPGRWRGSSTSSSPIRPTCRVMAASRIAASIQPVHLRSDATKARDAWGDRAERRAFLCVPSSRRVSPPRSGRTRPSNLPIHGPESRSR